MDCESFLQSFSDFLDGELEEHCLTEYREHLEGCAHCCQYDRAVRSGLRLVRDLDPPETAPDFMVQLQRRLVDRSYRSGGVGEYARVAGVAGLAVASLILITSVPLLRSNRRTLQLPPVVVEVQATEGSHSLWGPPPTFAPPASFLTAPSLTADPFLQRPALNVTLFREPLRTSLVKPGGTALTDSNPTKQQEQVPE